MTLTRKPSPAQYGLRTGGIVFVDTRDQQMSFDRPANGNPDLKRLLGAIELPPLVSMPSDYVLTKSFYLLSDFPGRWQGGKLWIEAGNGRVNDGVGSEIQGALERRRRKGVFANEQRAGRIVNPASASHRHSAQA